MLSSLMMAAFGLACAGLNASLSGYDERRYQDAPDAAATEDPEVTPLANRRRPRMLDPRAPFDAGNGTVE
jgi:hypothetical protein